MDNSKLLIVLDTSGSMYEGAKYSTAENIIKFINRYKLSSCILCILFTIDKLYFLVTFMERSIKVSSLKLKEEIYHDG